MEEKQTRAETHPITDASNSDKEPLPSIRQTVMAIISALAKYVGMHPVRMSIILKLDAVEEISQAEIHRKLGVGGAVVTRILKKMEAEGLIIRRPDPLDNRFTLVRLSDAGRARRDELLVKTKRIESALLQGLSPEEIESMQHTLRRIRQNAESLVEGTEEDESFPEKEQF